MIELTDCSPLDDVTTWHDDICVFYMMTHMRVFILVLWWGFSFWFYGDGMDVVLQMPLWTDLCSGHIMGLIYVGAPTVGVVRLEFQPHRLRAKWGCHYIAAWLTQTTLVSSSVHDVFRFSWDLNYIYKYVVYFQIIYIYI